MTPHLSEDLCLDYLTGELAVDETKSFKDHLGECPACRQSVEEYRIMLRSAVPLVAHEDVGDVTLGPVRWDFEEGEKRLYAAIETQAGTRCPFEHLKDETRPLARKTSEASLANFPLPSNLHVQLVAAASLILALALGMYVYRIGLKRGREQSLVVAQSKNDSASWRAQLEGVANERGQLESNLRDRELSISGLRAQLKEELKKNKELLTTLQSP